ncbi:MAG: hypothetical protein LBR38_05900 [Synergistaceae bacterium]|jgi:hypothetical protein|nr:hypothetical protein [Synergistaceae bacterium]
MTVFKTVFGRRGGVALHRDFLRYVEIKNGVATQQEIVPLDRGVVLNDSVADFDGLARAFGSLMPKTGGCPVVVGIPPKDSALRVVSYPSMSLADVKGSLRFNFGEHFGHLPYSYGEAAVCEVEMPSQEPNSTSVLVAVSALKTVEGIAQAAASVGMKVAAVEPMSLAIQRAAAGPRPRSGCYFVVFADVESTQIILCHNGSGVLFRRAAADLTNQEDAACVTPIASEISNTMAYVEDKGFAPEAAILCGVLERESTAAAALESSLPIRVERLDMWALWGVVPVSGSCGFEAAFGLAARDMSAGARFDMRSHDAAAGARDRGLSGRMKAFFAFVGVSVFFIFIVAMRMLSISGAIASAKVEAETLAAQRTALAAEVAKFTGEANDLMRTLKVMRDDLPTIEVFDALDSAASEGGVVLLSAAFNSDRGEQVPHVEIWAYTASNGSVTRFKDALERSGVFRGVAISERGAESFKVSLSVKPTAAGDE